MRDVLLAAAVGLTLVACASTPETDIPSPSPATRSDPTEPAPSTQPGTNAGADPGRDDPTSPSDDTAAPDCSLAPLAGVPTIATTFIVTGAGHTPPAMTGGTLDGDYVVHEATVYLPSAASGLVEPDKSTGTVAAWAVFHGSRYRLSLSADFMISSVLGPQSQTVDTESQGGFKTSGASITLDHACDTVIPDEAYYSFTDTGDGTAILLIKTPTAYGDVFLALQAQKSN